MLLGDCGITKHLLSPINTWMGFVVFVLFLEAVETEWKYKQVPCKAILLWWIQCLFFHYLYSHSFCSGWSPVLKTVIGSMDRSLFSDTQLSAQEEDSSSSILEETKQQHDGNLAETFWASNKNICQWSKWSLAITLFPKGATDLNFNYSFQRKSSYVIKKT